MVSLILTCEPAESDLLVAELWECETTGIVESDEADGRRRLEAYFETGDEARKVRTRFAAFSPLLRTHAPKSYVREFQDHWKPMAVGRRFWLSPPWDENPAPDGRMRIDYQAGMACGSGAHPCTRLCLEALDEFVEHGCRVLDVGVGSGILSLAANLLGAGLVVGCDTEHADAAIARSLVEAVFTGSLDSVRDGAFDLVVANISREAVDCLLADLRRVCKPGGTVIVSGFQQAELRPEWGLSWVRSLDGWCCGARRLPEPETERPPSESLGAD